MDNQLLNPEKFFKTACYFEGSLILLAVFLGWIADINPFADLFFSEQAIFFGIVATLPLFIIFLALQLIRHDAVLRIRQLLFETLGPSLHHYGWADLFVLAAIAGVSEEVLFRGVVQPWIEQAWGMNAGLVFSNIIFGLVHAVTPLYGILATLVGIYLGLSLDYGGERNLLTPIIVHGLYDFLAFLVIMRAYKASLNEEK
jgi:CAAX protease family protein